MGVPGMVTGGTGEVSARPPVSVWCDDGRGGAGETTFDVFSEIGLTGDHRVGTGDGEPRGDSCVPPVGQVVTSTFGSTGKLVLRSCTKSAVGEDIKVLMGDTISHEGVCGASCVDCASACAGIDNGEKEVIGVSS